MSYDIRLHDPVTKARLQLPEKHDLRGGTYAMGGTQEAWLNITYNYGKYYRDVFGDSGIRSLYGKTGAEAIPLLDKAIAQLGTERADDYWAATPGNAGAALANLRTLCAALPHGVLDGD